MPAKLIVYPPDEHGRRRVRYDGIAIGVAHHPSDIRVFLADAGLENAEDVDLTTRCPWPTCRASVGKRWPPDRGPR
ncbi:hypothetical protein [Streptomyces sp. NPDC002467]|uniref:hypothetical protein n=1 Tax=Streptomyces sp. NPDC002467 TaxID=3364647 RepID=UPI003682026B